MPGSALQRSLKSKNWNVDTIPSKFTLNTGHVKFFYNKGKYLHKRYISLINEMIKRGFVPDKNRVFKRYQWPDYLYNDWKPSQRDINIVVERITKRVNQKPNWYRKTKYNA